MSEQWRDVPGYEGLYQVSDHGRVKSFQRKSEKLLKPVEARRYLSVPLRIRGKATAYLVHKLVARAFLGEQPDGYVVNHLDGNRLNNHASNLEYCTRSENSRHAITVLRHNVGGKNHIPPQHAQTIEQYKAQAKQLQAADIDAIRDLAVTGETPEELAVKFKVPVHHVQRILRHPNARRHVRNQEQAS